MKNNILLDLRKTNFDLQFAPDIANLGNIYFDLILLASRKIEKWWKGKERERQRREMRERDRGER